MELVQVIGKKMEISLAKWIHVELWVTKRNNFCITL